MVDEYGDIEGFVTLEDILEEIVGEFTTDPATVTHKHVHREAPGVFIINASATIRALNRSLGWQLPTDGPKTLNGLLVEQLETLPEAGDGGDHRRIPVRSAADRREHHPHGACTPRRDGAGLISLDQSSSRRQRLVDALQRAHSQAIDGLARRVVARHQRRREPLLRGFAQPLFAVGHRPQLAGEPELAEGDQIFGRSPCRRGSKPAPAPPAGRRPSR